MEYNAIRRVGPDGVQPETQRDSDFLGSLETPTMVSLRTKHLLVFSGVAAWAVGAIVALRTGAVELATGLLGAQIVFAGVCLRLVCLGTRRRLKTLQAQIDAGGPVAVDGECGELAQAIVKLLASQRAAVAARDQQLALVLESEARARRAAQAVIDTLPHGIALLSPKGRVDLVNARGVWFGLEKDKSVDNVPHAWLKELLDQAIKSRQRTDLADAGGANGRHAKCRDGLVQVFEEGRELFFLPQAHPLIDAQGLLTGVIVVLSDVTAVRQADETRASLLSSLAHEIRTPMTSMQMSIYLLLDDAASRLTPRQLELLKAARDDTDRLHRIVENALAQRPG
jgi:signal transduction histidine kinase